MFLQIYDNSRKFLLRKLSICSKNEFQIRHVGIEIRCTQILNNLSKSEWCPVFRLLPNCSTKVTVALFVCYNEAKSPSQWNICCAVPKLIITGKIWITIKNHFFTGRTNYLSTSSPIRLPTLKFYLFFYFFIHSICILLLILFLSCSQHPQCIFCFISYKVSKNLRISNFINDNDLINYSAMYRYFNRFACVLISKKQLIFQRWYSINLWNFINNNCF